MKRPAALALLAATACVSTRTVGFSAAPLKEPPSGSSTCLKQKGGGSVDYSVGTVAGRPAIHLDGIVIGLSPTLDTPAELDGMTVYVGEECLDRGPPWACDDVWAVKRGPWWYFLHASTMHMAPEQLPADASALLASESGKNLLAALAKVELDDPTFEAFAALVEARKSGMYVRLGAFVAGAALQAAGAAGVGELTDVGKTTLSAGLALGDLISAEEERPILATRPKLVPVLELLRMLGGVGVLCVAKAS